MLRRQQRFSSSSPFYEVSRCDTSLLSPPLLPSSFFIVASLASFHIYKPQSVFAPLSRLHHAADSAEKARCVPIYMALLFLFTSPPILLHLRPAPRRTLHSICLPSSSPCSVLSHLVSVGALILCNSCHYLWGVLLFLQGNPLTCTWICVLSVWIYRALLCIYCNLIINSKCLAVQLCFICRLNTWCSFVWQEKSIPNARPQL